MKQIKPGRVPSLMGFIGSIIAIIFGIFWTGLVVSLAESHGNPPIVFIIFGTLFVTVGIGNAIYSYKNAFGKNQISEYDIVDTVEEEISEKISESSDNFNYCPYCGNSVKNEDFSFCPKCGKKLKT